MQASPGPASEERQPPHQLVSALPATLDDPSARKGAAPFLAACGAAEGRSVPVPR